MNIEQLRQSIKLKWLGYYQENREWLVRLGVWVNCDGQRRPSSSFILATLSVLEPQLTQMLPLIVDLNNNPDRIINCLGLNFNPEEELKTVEPDALAAIADPQALPLLTGNGLPLTLPVAPTNNHRVQHPARTDEDCRGTRLPRD